MPLSAFYARGWLVRGGMAYHLGYCIHLLDLVKCRFLVTDGMMRSTAFEVIGDSYDEILDSPHVGPAAL